MTETNTRGLSSYREPILTKGARDQRFRKYCLQPPLPRGAGPPTRLQAKIRFLLMPRQIKRGVSHSENRW